MFKRIRSERGFMLVELLVVLAILAILIVVVVPNLSGLEEADVILGIKKGGPRGENLLKLKHLVSNYE